MPYVQQSNPWDAIGVGLQNAGSTFQNLRQVRLQNLVNLLPVVQNNPELANDPRFKQIFGSATGGVDTGAIPVNPAVALQRRTAARQMGLPDDLFDIAAGIPSSLDLRKKKADVTTSEAGATTATAVAGEQQLKHDALFSASPRQLRSVFQIPEDAQLTADDENKLRQSAFMNDALTAAHKAMSTSADFRNLTAAQQAGILPMLIARENDQAAWSRLTAQLGEKDSQLLNHILTGAQQEYQVKATEWTKQMQTLQNQKLVAVTTKDKDAIDQQLANLQKQQPVLDYNAYAKSLGTDFKTLSAAVVRGLTKDAKTSGTPTSKTVEHNAVKGGDASVQSAASLINSGIAPSDPRVSAILDRLTPEQIGQVEAKIGRKLTKSPGGA